MRDCLWALGPWALRAPSPAAIKIQKPFPNWWRHSRAVRTQLGVPTSFSEYRPWQDRPGTQLLGVPECSRLRDVLDCAWESRLQMHDMTEAAPSEQDAIRQGFFCDYGQAVQQRPWGELHCFCKGSFACCPNSIKFYIEKTCISGCRYKHSWALRGIGKHLCI